MKSLKIGNHLLEKGKFPFVLAEMACAHDGDIDRAIAMIDGASDAGVDGIQFQLFSTDRLLAPYHSFYNKVKALEINLDDWPQIISHAKNKSLKVFANPLEVESLSVAIECGVDVLKIHSADVSNPDMLRGVAQCKLPVSLSTGGSTVDEIRKALILLSHFELEQVILMHGFQAFPTALEESNLDYMSTLESMFGRPVGYQDHVNGNSLMANILPLLAMAKGAVLLEKHITDSRLRAGTDHESALEPKEFKEFVNLLRDAWASFGTEQVRSLSEAELTYRKNFKKSIVASRDLPKGHILSIADVLYLRADKGVSPSDLNLLLGKTCKRKIKEFETFQFNDFEKLI